MTMYRIVRVVASNGRAYNVPLTAEQVAFYLRMAEYKAIADPSITFGDLLAAKSAEDLQHKRGQSS